MGSPGPLFCCKVKNMAIDIEIIKKIVLPVLEEMDLELVDLEILGNSRKRIIRIYIHRQGGVKLEQCEKTSRTIAEILERDDVIQERYVLEVSSPGLTRPLKTARDFERNIGEKVKVVLGDEEKSLEKTGTIHTVEAEQVVLTDGDKEHVFNITELKSAKIIIEF